MNLNISLNLLKSFIAVSDTLNFSEAAKCLYIPQSAVSQQIALLEEKVGTKLFFRDKRTVQLTNAGNVFLKYALKVLDDTNTVIDDVQKAQEGFIGSISIGFLAGPVINFLPALMKSFTLKYPNIKIKIRHLTVQQLNEKISTNEIDIAFGVSYGPIVNPNIEYQFLYESKICLYVSELHPIANNKTIALSSLANEFFVLRDRIEVSSWYDYTINLCTENGFYPHIIAEPQKLEAIMIFVDACLGVTILPYYLKNYATPTIRIIPLECRGNSVDVVIYRNLSYNNPSLPFFYEELNKMLKTPIYN
jgi:DNA-binding transcriptional LysR family regulator